jgi:hypothetical protein
MSLETYERDFTEVCFSLEPPTEALPPEGLSRERWLLYRRLVRSRLKEHLTFGYKRTIEALGPKRFSYWFERWLDEAPPTTRYIREVIPQFLAFALPAWREHGDVPPWLVDLARWENARWVVRYVDDPVTGVDEFDFDQVPVLSNAVELLDLDWAVHEKPPEGSNYAERPVRLCVYRRSDTQGAATWALNDLAADLLAAWKEGAQTVTETVKDVAKKHNVPITEGFIEKLSGLLADMIDRGVIRGSRAP